jgi:hypothetical protein
MTSFLYSFVLYVDGVGGISDCEPSPGEKVQITTAFRIFQDLVVKIS